MQKQRLLQAHHVFWEMFVQRVYQYAEPVSLDAVAMTA